MEAVKLCGGLCGAWLASSRRPVGAWRLRSRKRGRTHHVAFDDAAFALMVRCTVGAMAHRHHRMRRIRRRLSCSCAAHPERHQENGHDEQKPGEERAHAQLIAAHIAAIQTAMPIIIRF